MNLLSDFTQKYQETLINNPDLAAIQKNEYLEKIKNEVMPLFKGQPRIMQILGNLLIALTGVGVFAIAGHYAIYGRSFFSENKAGTTLTELSNELEAIETNLNLTG